MNWPTKGIDKGTQKTARNVAHTTARRSFIGRFGRVLVGTAALPLLPVARASAPVAAPGESARVPAQSTGDIQDPGDPSACDYWRYCSIDG